MTRTYERPCLWCKRDYPNEPPNMVTVAAERSDGICKRCADVWSAAILKRKEAREKANAAR